jgi:hypothetical protein
MTKNSLIVALAGLFLMSLALGQDASSQDAAKLRSLRARAEKGDSKAGVELGSAYEFGFLGAPRDYAEALKWYRKAAEEGDVGARLRIGGMYFEGKGVPKDYDEAARWDRCPRPSIQAMVGCKQIKYKDLPQPALDLLSKMKCDVDPNYDYGAAIDLNGDGEPEYQICCHDAAHGPCSSVLIGKVGSIWKALSADGGGFANCGNDFIVLEARHGGFNDVCAPVGCSASSAKQDKCDPAILQFIDGQYRSVEYTPLPPHK